MKTFKIIIGLLLFYMSVAHANLTTNQSLYHTFIGKQDGLTIPVKKTFQVNDEQFTMIQVEKGSFIMGGDRRSTGSVYIFVNRDETNQYPVHSVTLSGYMIGETEVTQALWKTVMGNNPNVDVGDVENISDNRPVTWVSWEDCMKFIDKLNELTEGQRPAGTKFDLPTEAEWEFAARGGNESKGFLYSGSNNVDDVAWYWINSGNKRQKGEFKTKKVKKNKGKPHPVKTMAPNELGIYDMSGNVWEWCKDSYGRYIEASQVNPQGAETNSKRLNRGGSFRSRPEHCKNAYRLYWEYNKGWEDLGFRIVLK